MASRCKSELVAALVKARSLQGRSSAADFESPKGLAAALLEMPDILGVGYGAKMVGGRPAGSQPALRVYVRAKRPRRDLSPHELVQSEINGVPTDVVAVGEIALARIKCGSSIGPASGVAGTLGCVVEKPDDPSRRFILSCGHVLADLPTAKPGDAIFAPALQDAAPGAAIKISRLEAWSIPSQANDLDAAIAELINPNDVATEIEEIGEITGQMLKPALYQAVRKHGRTTLHTVGVIMDVAAMMKIRYGSQTIPVDNLFAISGVGCNDFGWLGDSGALVVDAVQRNPLGLLLAVGSGITYAQRIEPVLRRFGVRIAKPPRTD